MTARIRYWLGFPVMAAAAALMLIGVRVAFGRYGVMAGKAMLVIAIEGFGAELNRAMYGDIEWPPGTFGGEAQRILRGEA